MKKETIDYLYKPFDVLTKPGGGGYKYIKSQDVIDRMNRAFSGNWSTNVLYQDIVEDTVIIRVNVCARTDEGEFCHDGYGSSVIKRFNSGPNKGKPVDLGSVFKAANSMAIRNACTRWGVGLYLEEQEDQDVNSDIPSFVQKDTPAITQEPKSFEKEVNQFENTFIPPKTNLGAIPAPLVENKKDNNTFVPPPFPVEPNNTVNNAVPKEQAIKENNLLFPKVPFPGGGSIPTNNTPKINADDPSISDVQKAAIDSLLSIGGVDYKDLVTRAFSDKGLSVDRVPEKEELTYQQAVTVIKFGNSLFRN